MSGHSKWSTIKRQKGATDMKRGLTFTKVAKAITVAAKLGNSSDPNLNPRLRVALDQARAVNMPKENIQRAIDRGLSKTDPNSIEEVIYEGFGPGKIAFYLETLTDNKLRTLQEVRNIFERAGGSLGSSGSTSYMFDTKGELKVISKRGDLEEEILELIDLGAEDVEDYENEVVRQYLVYVPALQLNAMSNKVTQHGFIIESSEIVLRPNTLITINNKDLAKKLLEFTQKLETHDDIQKVYANFDIQEELVNN